LAAFIRANLPLCDVPGVPGIRVHKAQPESGLWRLAKRDTRGFGPPYWAHFWAGGLALARYIVEQPGRVTGTRVLDLGAGAGLVGIVAAKAGARAVIAADVDGYAIAAVDLNAAANGVAVTTVHGDLTLGSPPDVDIVLVGDLFYEPELATRVTDFLDRCVAAGADVLVGDPGRAFLPLARLRSIAQYPVRDFGDPQGAAGTGSVFEFVRGSSLV
jgi:predicted nicotinamide N-methyase